MGRDTPQPLAQHSQGRGREGSAGTSAVYRGLSTDERAGEACTLSHSEDCCDTSRERENLEQNCLQGWQEKPALSCPAHCSDLAPAALHRLHLSWVLTASGVCTTFRGALRPLPTPATTPLGQARRAFPCFCCIQHLTINLQFTGQA